MNTKTILFVGGGTAGHIAPLLAVMEEVQKLGAYRCVYVGSEQDNTSPLITQSTLAFEKYHIRTGKLNRFLTLKHFKEGLNLGLGLVDAQILIKKIKPDCVFSKAGAISVPLVMAAKRQSVPIFSHETDVIPGLANRIIARYAQQIFTAYPTEFYRKLPENRLTYVGQPVRQQFYEKGELKSVRVGEWCWDGSFPLVTLIGGSQGARRLNQLVSEAWPDLLPKVQLVHLCGQRDLSRLETEAAKLPPAVKENLLIKSFLTSELPEIMRASTVVVSRAGGTIGELAATAKPTILIPLPSAAQDHQRGNARVLEKAGAAVVVEEEGLTAKHLKDKVLALVADHAVRAQLSSAIESFARPQAAAEMARALISIFK